MHSDFRIRGPITKSCLHIACGFRATFSNLCRWLAMFLLNLQLLNCMTLNRMEGRPNPPGGVVGPVRNFLFFLSSLFFLFSFSSSLFLLLPLFSLSEKIYMLPSYPPCHLVSPTQSCVSRLLPPPSPSTIPFPCLSFNQLLI